MEIKIVFHVFLGDLLMDNYFYGKNKNSNNTNNLDRQKYHTILDLKHYHLGKDSAKDTRLTYSKNGTPILRDFLKLNPTDYINNYKKSDILVNYTIKDNTITIYNISSHGNDMWDGLRYQVIYQNGGLAYWDGQNISENEYVGKIYTVEIVEVVNVTDTIKIVEENIVDSEKKMSLMIFI